MDLGQWLQRNGKNPKTLSLQHNPLSGLLSMIININFVHFHFHIPFAADKVEVTDHRVAVCRDHAKDACKRQQCKYYHIPIAVPPAHVMANMFKKDPTTSPLTPFTSTIHQTSGDALGSRSIEHISSTTATSVTESALNERHVSTIRSHRSATQTHL